MVLHDRDPDPTKDPAARAVLAAFDAAQDAGMPSMDCCRASVKAWRDAHPNHTAGYAGSQAVAVIHGSTMREHRDWPCHSAMGAGTRPRTSN